MYDRKGDNYLLKTLFSVQNDAESHALRNSADDPDDQHRPTVSKSKRNSDWGAYIRHRIHILSWIRKYDRSTAISDAISGVTLGLTMIPQSIAYAALAGLPSQYGLYSAFVGN